MFPGIILAAFSAFTVVNDHTNLVYRTGEDASFTVTAWATNGVKAASGTVKATLDNFGRERILSESFDLAKGNPFTVTGRLADAGFLRLSLDGGPLGRAAWSVAYDPRQIRPGAARPDDFLAYWRREKARLAREVKPDVRRILLEDRSTNRWNVYSISLATFGGKRVHGFMSVPKDASKGPFPVHFNVPGAGPSVVDCGRRENAVCVSMNVHPYEPVGDPRKSHLEMNRALSAKWNVDSYEISGIGKDTKREDYFFHDVILGIDRALDWVAELPETDRTRIRYSGTSQGGGFGLVLAGLDPGRISRLAVFVPALADLLGSRAGRQSGWPQIAERQRTPEAKATAEAIAPYFDAAHFASYVTCPVRMVVGFADTCCAPPAVYSAFNAIPSADKEIVHGFGMSHGVNWWFYRQLDEWISDPKGPEGPTVRPPAVQPRTLAPNRFAKLPLGDIRPEGWLRRQLELQANGLVGRLYEHSEFLAPDNGWLNPSVDRWKFPRKDAWEEQSYWFRTFVKLAVLTGEPRLLDVTRTWVDKIVAGADKDGWFGAQNKKLTVWRGGQEMTDVWGHMPMCEALWSWYEATGDGRIPKLLVDFFRFCLTLPEDRLIPHVFPERGDWKYTIQHPRACDVNPVLFACHELTKDPACLELAERLFRRRRQPKSYIDRHNVNFAQLFPYQTIFFRQSGNPAHRRSADFWYDLHMSMWGQMPRGAFAADENVREGNVDPRYGTESCTWCELARSFQFLGLQTGETKWADRTEDVLFNHYPVCYTPDWKHIHYLTAPNQVMLDAGWDHDYGNYPPQIAYSDTMFRCCRHNAGLGFPLFTEHLAFTDHDGALVFWMYAPHRGETRLAGGGARWRMDTRYPFRERIALEIEPKGRPVPVRLRVPAWATSFEVLEGEHSVARAAKGERFVTLPVPVSGKTRFEVRMGAKAEYRFWPRNGAVTVERGPLGYSLAIGEQVRTVPRPTAFSKTEGSASWPESPSAREKAEKLVEYLPTTPWNYGLDVSAPIEFRERAWTNDCFVAANAPCEIFVRGRRLAEWTLRDHQPAPLQESPAYTTEPLERLRFIPLGCARLRLSVLPEVTDDPSGVRWTRDRFSVPRDERAKIIDF